MLENYVLTLMLPPQRKVRYALFGTGVCVAFVALITGIVVAKRNPSSPASTRSSPPSYEKPVTNGPNSRAAIEACEDVLSASREGINNNLFLYETPTGGWEPSTIYRYDGLAKALRVMYEDGVNGQYFYVGEEGKDGHVYGLVNIAAFLAQSMKETIRYDACDENSVSIIEMNGGFYCLC